MTASSVLGQQLTRCARGGAAALRGELALASDARASARLAMFATSSRTKPVVQRRARLPSTVVHRGEAWNPLCAVSLDTRTGRLLTTARSFCARSSVVPGESPMAVTSAVLLIV